MRALRILLVNKFWKPVGGVEQHCQSLIELLTGEGHEVVRFGMEDSENEPPLAAGHSVSPVSFHDGGIRERARAASRACLGIETRRTIGDLLAREDFDVVHVVHAYHQLGMTFLPLLRRRGIPAILDLHDYKVGCPRYLLFDDRADRTCTVCIDRRGAWAWAPVARRCWNGSRASGAVLAAEALSSRLARAYTSADSVLVRNELQRSAAIHAGVPPERIRVIPNWVEDREVDRGTVGEHMLFVGRLTREKGVHLLVEASARAGVPVRVAGDGPMRDELESLSTGIGADVTFLGWQSRDELFEELQKARALVVPSIWPEVFPLVVCEAFAAGVPVIGSDTGGHTGLLAEERGFLFPVDDRERLEQALRQVVDDPAAAEKRARKAHSYSREHLSHDTWRAHYRDVYEDLLGSQAATVRSGFSASP